MPLVGSGDSKYPLGVYVSVNVCLSLSVSPDPASRSTHSGPLEDGWNLTLALITNIIYNYYMLK